MLQQAREARRDGQGPLPVLHCRERHAEAGYILSLLPVPVRLADRIGTVHGNVVSLVLVFSSWFWAAIGRVLRPRPLPLAHQPEGRGSDPRRDRQALAPVRAKIHSDLQAAAATR
jgi:hypothetical protein